MKRAIAVLIIFFIMLNMTGCEAVRKKFSRKRKEPVKMPHIYQVKKYVKKPSPELYQKHYVYWMTWQSELIAVLGQNHKKDVRCIEEIVGNLQDMQNILIKEKGDQLAPHIDKIMKVRDTIINEELSVANRDYIKRTLEREDRNIKREFSLKKVKKYLKTNFEDEPQDAGKAN